MGDQGGVAEAAGGDRIRMDGPESFRAAVAEYVTELKANPTDTLLRVAAARAARELGDFLLMRNRTQEVGTFYQQDLQAFRGLLQTGEMLAVRQELGRVYYRTATLALRKKDAKAAARPLPGSGPIVRRPR